MLLAVYTGYVLPPSVLYVLYSYKKKLKKYEKKNTKTFDGNQNSLVMRKSAFCNCAADQRLWFRYTECTISLINILRKKGKTVHPCNSSITIIEPRHEKTGFRGFRPGPA